MKLAWKDIEPFVKKPAAKARAILVYGPDAGLVKERAKTMALSVVSDLNDPFNVAQLSESILSEDPARLADEAMAMSMMGGARLIRIENGADKIAPVLREYLEDPSRDNLVIIEAGELGPKSPLRALFEKSQNAAAVPCYVEDEKGIATLIRQMLSESGYSAQADAVTWLASNIAGDRGRGRGRGVAAVRRVLPASRHVRLRSAVRGLGQRTAAAEEGGEDDGQRGSARQGTEGGVHVGVHSRESATTGSRRAALRAGRKPKTTPTAVDTAKAATIDAVE